MQLANEINGFAGYYVNPTSGLLVAYVKDSARAFPAAAAALNAHLIHDGLGMLQSMRPHGVQVQRADFDFQTLSDYRDAVVDNVFGAISGVVSVDLDEQINRVTIGVTTTAITSRVLELLAHYGVPPTAINFSQRNMGRVTLSRASGAKPRRFYGTVLENGSPDTLGGGMAFEDKPTNSRCSVGAIMDSGSTRMFMSASHCTQYMFHLDGDTIETTNGTAFAVERGDRAPTGTGSNLFISWHDRSSDAATFHPFSQATRKGAIARPNSRDSVGIGGARDTSINASHPWLFVTGKMNASDIPSGQEIDKIGMRSGWVHATMTGTCVDNLSYDNYWGWVYAYCNGESSHLLVRQGDSGGPVFIWDGHDGAILIGLTMAGEGTSGSYWGGAGTEYSGTEFTYWSAAEYDQGTFDVLDPTTVDTPSPTGSINGSSQPVISWSAPTAYNSTASSSYYMYRSIWNAATGTFTQSYQNVGFASLLTYTDASSPYSFTAVSGLSQPDMCTYSSEWLAVQAYNQGATSGLAGIWFTGPANGPGGPSC